MRRFGREFPRGTVLFREGDPGGDMYVVNRGKVSISARVGAVEKVLSTLGQGEFLGEMSILNGAPRSATATCVEDCLLLVVDARTFETMVRASSEIAVRMIKKMAGRLAEADRQIENLLLRDARARVVHFVSGEASRHPEAPLALSPERPGQPARRGREAGGRRAAHPGALRAPGRLGGRLDRSRPRPAPPLPRPPPARLPTGDAPVRIRVLGASGGELRGHGSTCFLVDGRLALDAGALTSRLDLAELDRVDHVLVTHAHLDHVKDVPLLADLMVGRRRRPVTVHASPGATETLRRSLFNGRLWPDFTRIPSARSPVVRLEPVRVRRPVPHRRLPRLGGEGAPPRGVVGVRGAARRGRLRHLRRHRAPPPPSGGR